MATTGLRAAPAKPVALPGPAGAPGQKPASGALQAPLGWLEQVAGMMILTGKTLVAVLRPPFSWREGLVEEAWIILKRCLVPLAISQTFICFGAPGLQAANLLSVFGTLDREGAFFVMASVREIATWATSMVVAGVAGTAICADLGARKVRDELDAMAVMGLDPVRELVAPRFLALGFMTTMLNIFALVFGVFGGWLATVPVWGETTAGYISTFSSNFTLPDLLGASLKTTLFGFIVAIVCCYKGMNVKGGAEGVGRAVNQAVVISFAAIWIVNYAFTSTLLAAFPETGNLH